MEVRIDYDPAEEIDSLRHDAWERIVNKYGALSIGHEGERRGTSSLFLSEDMDVEKLREDLHPIKILD